MPKKSKLKTYSVTIQNTAPIWVKLIGATSIKDAKRKAKNMYYGKIINIKKHKESIPEWVKNNIS